MESILTDGLLWAYKHCNALKFDKLNFDGLAGKCQKMSLSNFCTIRYVEECQCTSSHKGTTGSTAYRFACSNKGTSTACDEQFKVAIMCSYE